MKILQQSMLKHSSESKRRKEEREKGKEKRRQAGGRRKEGKKKATSVTEVLFWLWFLGHSVFWEMMMSFGKCLFS